MPATLLPETTAPSYWSTTGVAMTMTAADTVNANSITAKGHKLLLAWNSGVGAASITITSTPHSKTGRTGSVSAQTITAGQIRIFILKPNGWQDSGGLIQLSATVADVKFGVMALP